METVNLKIRHSGVQPLPCLFNIKQIQSLVGGKSKSTIYRWIQSGIFPEPIKVCGSSLWTEESILLWREAAIQDGGGI